MRKRLQFVVFLVLAAIAAASMWFYVIGILRAHQIADAEAKQIPRGNLSDLYPRWLGTRELLLHHRNPYSREVALEIQEGYYGRRLDPARLNDPKDQQGFAYPVYVVFLLAPLVGIPFPVVLSVFYWLLAILTAIALWLWLRVLRWQLPPSGLAICILLILGSFPAVQGIKLQQLSLLVAGLMAGAAACVASGFLFIGGALLALATIKPQLAWPLVAWLLLWAVSNWRARQRFVLGFGLVMALLLVGAEIILPGWWLMFADALGQYRRYTQSQSVLEVILGQILGPAVARVVGESLAVLAVLACGSALWKLRRSPAEGAAFGEATALALALTVVVVPMYAPYNQVLMVPAVLALVRDWRFFTAGSWALRLAYAAGAFALAWQWMGSLFLSGAYLLGSFFAPFVGLKGWAISGWKLPFFATFALPVFVFALILLDVRRMQQRDQAERVGAKSNRDGG